MIPGVTLERLTLNDGESIELADSDVVVIVGPNNSGKSAALRSIRDQLFHVVPSPVIKDIAIKRTGTPGDVLAFLQSNSVWTGSADNPIFHFLGGASARSDIATYWSPGRRLGNIAGLFCRLIAADDRLSVAQPPHAIDLLHAGPEHPLHEVQRDDALEAKLSKHFRRAFGEDLILHRGAGQKVPLYVGQRPAMETGEDRISAGYLRRLEGLAKLSDQGDGMKSFVGVLLYAMRGTESIVMVDEPEAFLHPPQARLLGKLLVTERPPDRQLFVATHSGDVLRGMLDANNMHLRILRIVRDGMVNHVSELRNDKVGELWSDPLLRTSNVFDGLFHELVVVTESDADVRFYSAVLDAIYDGERVDERHPDVMITHAGGKQRVHVILRALKGIGVRVKAIVDFDVLRQEEDLRRIVEAAGAEWEAYRPAWHIVHSAIEARRPELNGSEARRAIEQILERVGVDSFDEDVKTEIQSVFRRTSPWSSAKHGGRAFVPSGEATEALNRLLIGLREVGIFVVADGELESFDRSVGGKSQAWVNKVLQKNISADPVFTPARTFVKDVVA